MKSFPSLGACHGFEVRSPLPHRFLASGGGEPLLIGEIVERRQAAGTHLLAWPERNGRLAISIWRRDVHRYEVLTSSLGVFEVDTSSATLGVPANADPLRREMLTFGPPLALLITARGDLALHGAAIEMDGRAVLITGPGGSGKSTLTAAASARGLPIQSDDLCRLSSSLRVHTGPQVIRLRSGSPALAETMATAGRAGGKVHVFPTSPPTRPASALACIALLEKEAAEPGVAQVRADEVIPHLWSQAFFLPGEADIEECFSKLARVASEVPVYRVYYPHDQYSIPATLDRLWSLAAAS